MTKLQPVQECNLGEVVCNAVRLLNRRAVLVIPGAQETAEQILCQLRDAPQPPCIMLLQSGCVHEPMCFMINAAAKHKALG